MEELVPDQLPGIDPVTYRVKKTEKLKPCLDGLYRFGT
jgi:hypothetical protein